MSQEKTTAEGQNENVPAPPEPAAPRLDVGRLETIQRWAQYGAAAALFVTIAFFVLASYKLSGLLGEITTQGDTIEKNKKIIADQQATMADYNAVIANQNATIANQNKTISAFAVAYDDKTTSAPSGPAQIPARVYMHIARDDQSDTAKEVANQLRLKGYVVPRITQGAAPSLELSDVRYYEAANPEATRQAEKEADDIIAIVSAITGVRLKKERVRYSSNVRPRHYEVWFGKNFPPSR